MTHNPQSTLIEEVMEALSEHDSEGIARALSIILNSRQIICIDSEDELQFI